jgi:hypothetical protein
MFPKYTPVISYKPVAIKPSLDKSAKLPSVRGHDFVVVSDEEEFEIVVDDKTVNSTSILSYRQLENLKS